MLFYYVSNNNDWSKYKSRFQEPSCILCLDIDENIIDDLITFALQDTKVYVDVKIGFSVCSTDDEFKHGYGCRIAKKRMIPMRFIVASVNANNTYTTACLRPDENWMRSELYEVSLQRDKTDHKMHIAHVSYKRDCEARTYKQLLQCPEYKKALMDVAIEQSLKEDK